MGGRNMAVFFLLFDLLAKNNMRQLNVQINFTPHLDYLAAAADQSKPHEACSLIRVDYLRD